MNFPLFHQVIVAGGREPDDLHSNVADLDMETGTCGGIIRTMSG